MIACRVLEAHGVRTVFAVPGTQNLDLHEALRRSGIRVVPSTHELAASFMAIGYYRASGRIAPLVTIPGPGFTYALTGLAEARHDSAALLHLVGPHTGADRYRTFQAIDHVAVASSIVKAAHRVSTSAQIAPVLSGALAQAAGGEPGPVLVEWTREALDGSEELPVPAAPEAADLDPAEVDSVARWLGGARRPLLYVGQGCIGAAPSVRAVAEWLGAPVVTTVSGRGLVPEDHPLVVAHDIGCGSLGRLNRLLLESDAILAVGCRLAASATAGFRLRLPAERVVHVDASPEPPGCPVRRSLTASAESFLPALLERLREQPGGPAGAWPRAQVARARRHVRENAGPEPAVDGSRPATAAAFFGALRGVLPRDAILVTDSGTHQVLARRHFPVLSARGLITPSDFQSMGFGLPAAIGAKLAAPERPVVALVGDGGFAICGLELLTAVREGLPLTVIVFVDNYLNRIRLEQLARYGRTAGTEVRNPDFADFARSVGARHFHAGTDAREVLAAAIAAGGVSLVEVPVRDSLAVVLARMRGLALEAARHTHRSVQQALEAAPAPPVPRSEEPAG